MSQTARANLKTIHGISTNLNAVIKRLESDKIVKEEFTDKFLDFIMKDPEELVDKREDLVKHLKRAVRSIDLVDNESFAKKVNVFRKEFAENEPLDVENCKMAREEMLDAFFIAYAQDTHAYEKFIIDAGWTLIEFVNKLTHFVDTVRGEAKDYIKHQEE